MRLPALPFLLVFMAGLAGCSDEAAEPARVVRPILSVVTQKTPDAAVSLAGTVEPRYSRDIGFRVLGRVLTRNVDVGQQVQKGQLLASLDPTAPALSVRSLEGELASAEAQVENARASRRRQQELVARKFAPQSELDSAEQALSSAEASVARTRASLVKAREQLDYTRIVSETDGVVVAVDAEVGQTVPAGQTVVTVAQPDILEAVVDGPNGVADRLRPGDPFQVTLQINPLVKARGTLREIAPEADAATRTRRIRITLTDPASDFRIGTTVDASPITQEALAIHLPASAILKTDEKTFVWVVDPEKSTVSRRPVEIAQGVVGDIRVVGGLETGERVAVAGVNTLEEGQEVQIGQELVP